MMTDTQPRSPRIKRTYNLSRVSIETVKTLVEVYHVAGSQDAVVERAIRDLDRRVRDARDAALWSRAARDSEFTAEMQKLESEFASDDRHAWPS